MGTGEPGDARVQRRANLPGRSGIDRGVSAAEIRFDARRAAAVGGADCGAHAAEIADHERWRQKRRRFSREAGARAARHRGIQQLSFVSTESSKATGRRISLSTTSIDPKQKNSVWLRGSLELALARAALPCAHRWSRSTSCLIATGLH